MIDLGDGTWHIGIVAPDGKPSLLSRPGVQVDAVTEIGAYGIISSFHIRS